MQVSMQVYTGDLLNTAEECSHHERGLALALCFGSGQHVSETKYEILSKLCNLGYVILFLIIFYILTWGPIVFEFR